MGLCRRLTEKDLPHQVLWLGQLLNLACCAPDNRLYKGWHIWCNIARGIPCNDWVSPWVIARSFRNSNAVQFIMRIKVYFSSIASNNSMQFHRTWYQLQHCGQSHGLLNAYNEKERHCKEQKKMYYCCIASYKFEKLQIMIISVIMIFLHANCRRFHLSFS